MPSAVNVAIHPSQFPENVRRDLLESLRLRQVNHKFHYDSIKQTQKWLALHQAHSPSRYDAECLAIYDRSFEGIVKQIRSRRVHLVGLGCGGGQKDTRLLNVLRSVAKDAFYTPVDVSTAMVLVARRTVSTVIDDQHCFPFVCDLATADDLSNEFAARVPEVERLFTFFGMIPNFEPENILPKLARLIRPVDRMLFSANLAPGPDYLEGIRRILPQYDNQETREWLITFLLDLGIERNDGGIVFSIEGDQRLRRVEARFNFTRPREISVDSERFSFAAGESIRLFFSYRYTPGLVRHVLTEHGLHVEDQWVAASEEEGVFLISKA